MSILDFELADSSDFKEIAYIQILSFAVHRARRVGYGSGYEAKGFLLCELKHHLRGQKKYPQINDGWLISCLLSICNVYDGNGNAIEKSSYLCGSGKINLEFCRFVISADEYMRFIELDSLYKSQRQIKIALWSIFIAIIIGLITIVLEINPLNQNNNQAGHSSYLSCFTESSR